MLTRVLRVRHASLWRHAQRHGKCCTSTTFRWQGSAMSFGSTTPVAQDKPNEGSATSGEPRSSTLEAFRSIVVSRTAANSFSDKQVEEEVLRDIMALTQSAPSSFNIQPWSVVLVREPLGRERLATAMMGGNGKKILAAPVIAVFCADLEPSKRIHRMVDLSREAGMAEVDVAKLSLAVNLFSGEGLVGNVVRNAVTSMASPMQPAPEVGSADAWSFKNTALAAQTFILSCTAHGLATAPMEGFDARRVRAVLDVPDRYGIPMVVCTGYPAPSGAGDGGDTRGETGGKRWRYPAEEVVFDGAFGVGMAGIDPVVP